MLIWTERRHDGNDSVEESYGPHYARQWQRGGALDRVEFDWMDPPERTFGADASADPQGERWRYSYDDAGRLIQATDPRGMSDLTSDLDRERLELEHRRGDLTRGRLGDRGRGPFEDEQPRTGDLARERFAVADREERVDRKSTRLNSSHAITSRMPSSA